jgi:hypothetical protein
LISPANLERKAHAKQAPVTPGPLRAKLEIHKLSLIQKLCLTVLRRIIVNIKSTTRLHAALGVALALTAFNAVWAQNSEPKTREQVRAELLEAQRNGDIMADGETGKKLNEVFPNAYPAKATTGGLTREQVKAELIEAERRGDVMVDGESGRKLNEFSPQFKEPIREMYTGR